MSRFSVGLGARVFTGLSAICVSSMEKCLFQSFSLMFKWILCLFIVELQSSFAREGYEPPHRYMTCKYVPFWSFSFHSLDCDLCKHEVLAFIQTERYLFFL